MGNKIRTGILLGRGKGGIHSIRHIPRSGTPMYHHCSNIIWILDMIKWKRIEWYAMILSTWKPKQDGSVPPLLLGIWLNMRHILHTSEEGFIVRTSDMDIHLSNIL